VHVTARDLDVVAVVAPEAREVDDVALLQERHLLHDVCRVGGRDLRVGREPTDVLLETEPQAITGPAAIVAPGERARREPGAPAEAPPRLLVRVRPVDDRGLLRRGCVIDEHRQACHGTTSPGAAS
jgi:hypothetical protein